MAANKSSLDRENEQYKIIYPNKFQKRITGDVGNRRDDSEEITNNFIELQK
jgi:hypothetical protein